MTPLTRIPTAIGVVLALALAVPAQAAAGKLDKPGVALPADFPKAAQAQIQSALERKDCKFLGGFWLNSWTSLRYGGNTLALNLFMEELARCPGTGVSVQLRKLDDDCDWRVGHSPSFTDNSFLIEVNLNSKSIDLERLVVPDVKGPRLPAN